MYVLSLVAWFLIGVSAAWVAKKLTSDQLGWLGLGLFGVAGAISGGIVALGVADAFTAGVVGSGIGAVLGVLIRGAAEEIRSRGPGFAI